MSAVEDHQASAAHILEQIEALTVSATVSRDFGEEVATEAAEAGITGDLLGRSLDTMSAADLLIISLQGAKVECEALIAALQALGSA